MFSVKIKENTLTYSDEKNNLIFEEKTEEENDDFDVFGVFGLIKFNEQKYLVFILDANEVGEIESKPVYEAKKGKIIQIGSKTNTKEADSLKKGIESFFQHEGLYFSDYKLYNRYPLENDKFSQSFENNINESSEMTNHENGKEVNDEIQESEKKNDEKLNNMPGKQDNSTQLNENDPKILENETKEKQEDSKDRNVKDLIESEEEKDFEEMKYDDINRNFEFLFNKKPIESLTSHFKSLSFQNSGILKCIQGNFSSFEKFVLISRRCPRRIGARYFSRGIGKDGYPSNFVETEQIILGNSSYLQIRGSIPLFWYHDVNLKFHPDIKVLPFKTKLLVSHAILERIYKIPVIYLNLIRSKGYESELYRKFNELYKPNHELFYNFDFKNEIHKKIFPFDFSRTGFSSKRDNQREIIRTNCIDCLDRTNSMQYLIGKVIFDQQLKEADIQNENEYKKAFQKAFYQNGNKISLQYSGTNAMSSYYITDGGMSALGLSKDSFYALYRYLINRFTHGRYHTIVNIIVGNLEDGQVNFNNKMITFQKIYSVKLLLIIPLILLLFKNTSKFYLKLLFSLIFILYITTLILQIDYPTFALNEIIKI